MLNNDMKFVQHLEELRKRIIICLFSIFVFTLVSYGYSKDLLHFVTRSVGKLVFIQPMEAFLAYLKISFSCGLFFSLPVIIYNLCVFITPGLLPKERKYMLVYIVFGSILFLAGCLFSYFVVIPYGTKFLLSYGSDWLIPMISVGSYISFFCMMIFIFGIVFEMPAVIFLLTNMGIVDASFLRKNRKYMILVIFIISAILTPPDVFSQVVMAIPLLILYELSIFISYLGRKK